MGALTHVYHEPLTYEQQVSMILSLCGKNARAKVCLKIIWKYLIFAPIKRTIFYQKHAIYCVSFGAKIAARRRHSLIYTSLHH